MTTAIASHDVPPGQFSRPLSVPAAWPANAYPCTGLSARRIIEYTAFALVMIFLNRFGLPGNALFFMIIIAMVASRPLYAVMGMNLAMLGLVANVAFVQKTIVWTFARFANLFLFAGRFGLAGGNAAWSKSPAYLWLTAFCVVAAFCSLVSGYYVHIALLKLFSFWLATSGFFAAIHTIRVLRIDTTEWFVAQTVVVCALCGLSLILGVAQNFKEFASQIGLYNLAFYHSQTMGPGAAFLITYCACVYLFSGHRNRWICLPIVGCLAYFLSLTGSRTGFGTAVIGVGTAFAAAFAWKQSRWRRPRLNLSRSSLVAMALLGAIGIGCCDVALGGRLSRRFASFITKSRGEKTSISLEETIASRQGIAEQTWQNFLQSPITGIGFQVAKTDDFVRNATLFSAPMEKGFLPTAILEEVGVLGAFVFVGFVVSMFRLLIRERNIPGLAMFVAHLASNLGEASYFAVAGQGGYAWMMVMAAIVLGDRCMSPAWLALPRRGRAWE